ncbi:MAG: phosphoglucosamine mutase [Ilumatobacteraceae bacterium]|nr:phosphoglucosamine mutase [Ilumatobacteraceae bacterium]
MRFGTDGIRGVANVELTADLALRLGRAAARVLGDGPAVVGGDTRRSTPMIEAALVAGLASEGVEVHRLGVTPTPAVAFHAARLGGFGAVVSASHNPFHDNGIKVFGRGGSKLSDDVEAAIAAGLDDLPAPDGPVGAVVDRTGFDDAYVEHVVGVLEGRRLGGLPVVIDAANGAASRLAEEVIGRADAEPHVIAASPDGTNINDRCGATHPEALAAEVVRTGAAAGLALDGDADRLIAVDETGRVVDGDHVMAICALDLHAQGRLRHDTVVVTVMTNLGFRLAMRAAGIELVETAVGDRYVLEALRAGGYSIGGEQSGHVVFPDHATTGDGLLTGLVLLDVLRRSGRPLSELAAAAMTSLPQVLVNVRVRERPADVDALLADEIGVAAARLGADGRVLVRSSGTEPLVRVMVEAPTRELATSVADGLAAAVVARLG